MIDRVVETSFQRGVSIAGFQRNGFEANVDLSCPRIPRRRLGAFQGIDPHSPACPSPLALQVLLQPHHGFLLLDAGRQRNRRDCAACYQHPVAGGRLVRPPRPGAFFPLDVAGCIDGLQGKVYDWRRGFFSLRSAPMLFNVIVS